MNYPILIHKEKNSDYGVQVPDLPGCFSAGRTLDEALLMAREAVELHLEGLLEEGDLIPEPGSIEQYRKVPHLKDGIWAIVSVDPKGLRLRAKRINISMPERVLDAVDRFAAERKETRSGLLAKAAKAYIQAESRRSGPLRSPRRSRRRRSRSASG